MIYVSKYFFVILCCKFDIIRMYLTEVRMHSIIPTIVRTWRGTRQNCFECFGTYPHLSCAVGALFAKIGYIFMRLLRHRILPNGVKAICFSIFNCTQLRWLTKCRLFDDKLSLFQHPQQELEKIMLFYVYYCDFFAWCLVYIVVFV